MENRFVRLTRNESKREKITIITVKLVKLKIICDFSLQLAIILIRCEKKFCR